MSVKTKMKRVNADFTPPELHQRAQALGQALKLARIARDLTRQDCAERAHISPSTLARIEGGDVAVSMAAWLMAMNQVGLIGLLEAPSQPENDVIGTLRRKGEVRQRVRKTGGEYDF